MRARVSGCPPASVTRPRMAPPCASAAAGRDANSKTSMPATGRIVVLLEGNNEAHSPTAHSQDRQARLGMSRTPGPLMMIESVVAPSARIGVLLSGNLCQGGSMRTMRTIASLVVTLLIATLLAGVAAQQPTAPPPPAPQATPAPAVTHDTVRGAIRAIDVNARTVDITSGVGFAIHVVQLRLPTSLPITDRESGQAESIRLGELRLGDVIRASFGGQVAPFVAYTFERVGRMVTGVDSLP